MVVLASGSKTPFLLKQDITASQSCFTASIAPETNDRGCQAADCQFRLDQAAYRNEDTGSGLADEERR
jgi:hypothetical protein